MCAEHQLRVGLCLNFSPVKYILQANDVGVEGLFLITAVVYLPTHWNRITDGGWVYEFWIDVTVCWWQTRSVNSLQNRLTNTN